MCPLNEKCPLNPVPLNAARTVCNLKELLKCASKTLRKSENFHFSCNICDYFETTLYVKSRNFQSHDNI